HSRLRRREAGRRDHGRASPRTVRHAQQDGDQRRHQMIASVGSAFATSDTSATRESRFDDNSQAQSFAGVLSGVMHSHTPKPEESKPKDRTSELDKSDSSDDGDDSSSDKNTASTAST